MPLAEIHNANIMDINAPLGRKKAKLAKKKAKAQRQRTQKCAWDADVENADPNQDNTFVPAAKAFSKGDDAAKWYDNEFAEESTAALRSELVSAEPADPTDDADANGRNDDAARHESIVPRDWSTWYTDQFGQNSDPVEEEEKKEGGPKMLQLPQVSNLNISWDTQEYLEHTDARFGVEDKYSASNDSWVDSAMQEFEEIENGTDDAGEMPKEEVVQDHEMQTMTVDEHIDDTTEPESNAVEEPADVETKADEEQLDEAESNAVEELDEAEAEADEEQLDEAESNAVEELDEAEAEADEEQLDEAESNAVEELDEAEAEADEEQLDEAESNAVEEPAEPDTRKKATRVFKPKPSTRALTKPSSPKFATSKRAQRIINQSSSNSSSSSSSSSSHRKHGADLSKNMLRSVSVTIPVSPHFATAGRKRSASVLSTIEQEEQYIQEHQFKAQPINAGLQQQHQRGPHTGPVGSRTRARTAAGRKLTCPRSPKLQSATRSRAHAVLSTAELEEQYMQEHQFKPRAVGEGVPETTYGGGGGNTALTLTKPKSPALSTASRKRPAAALSRDALEEEYMRTHQFKPRAVGEGVPEASATRTSRRGRSSSRSFKPTIAQAPKLSTSSRRRPASALSRDELEEEYMRTHQFKPRAVGEGVPTGEGRSKRAKTAQETFQPTVPVPPKLRTSSRRRAAAVLSTEEYEEQYMQEHQFKARPFYK